MEDTNTKPMNAWINHVKAYQAEHGCTYAVALKESKATYERTTKPVKAKKKSKTPEPEPETVPEPESAKPKRQRKPRAKKTKVSAQDAE